MLFRSRPADLAPREVHGRTDLLLLDVREPGEWAAGHIDGAMHIPLRDLPSRIGSLDRAAPVVAVCRSGNRSAQAARWLQAQGFAAHNLAGGMRAWAAEGLPVASPTGRPGTVV